jgi:hypothetical protein
MRLAHRTGLGSKFRLVISYTSIVFYQRGISWSCIFYHYTPRGKKNRTTQDRYLEKYCGTLTSRAVVFVPAYWNGAFAEYHSIPPHLNKFHISVINDRTVPPNHENDSGGSCIGVNYGENHGVALITAYL